MIKLPFHSDFSPKYAQLPLRNNSPLKQNSPYGLSLLLFFISSFLPLNGIAIEPLYQVENLRTVLDVASSHASSWLNILPQYFLIHLSLLLSYISALFGLLIFLTFNCHSPVIFPYTHICRSYYSIQYNVQILNLLLFWLNWLFFFLRIYSLNWFLPAVEMFSVFFFHLHFILCHISWKWTQFL